MAQSSLDSIEDRQNFECWILKISIGTKGFRSIKYGAATPKDVARDLKSIDRGLTLALQTLLALNLQHEHGQELGAFPYNFPVASLLRMTLLWNLVQKYKGPQIERDIDLNYPTKLIDELVELRDAARLAFQSHRPSRGNDAKRTDRSARISKIGSDLVLHYRATFGYRAPISKTGWLVDLADKALQAAGVVGADPAEMIRTAVNNDKAGLIMPATPRQKRPK